MKHALITAAFCLAAAVTAPAVANEADYPPGMQPGHLNIVYSVTDEEQVHKFYGEALGLPRMPNIDFPGDMYMIRYQKGRSEIKFIVTHLDLPIMEGGMANARGIRLLAFHFPRSEQEGILARLGENGYDVPVVRGNGPHGRQNGMTKDGDGNQVELFFVDDDAPQAVFDQIQIGLAVSDKDAMDAFLTDILGYQADVVDEPIQRYAMGQSQVKFWRTSADKPTWNGGPFDKIGYNLVQAIVPNVDAVRDAVVARGGTIHTEPFPLGQLATIMFVESPDGILFEFAGPLAKRFRNETSD